MAEKQFYRMGLPCFYIQSLMFLLFASLPGLTYEFSES
jgi:hypothetical protein